MRTFDYYEKGNNICFPSKGFFKIKKRKLIFFPSIPLVGLLLSSIFTRYFRIYERFISYLIPATEIEFYLEVVK